MTLSREELTMHYICRTLNIAFAHDTESNKYDVLLGCEPKEGGGYTFSNKREYENPLEAWSNYIMSVDSLLRRRLGDKLEAEGKNRYTGESSRR